MIPVSFMNSLINLNDRTGAHPQLTWYGHDGRIELSGNVLNNWINKTTNLLIEEFDAESGVTIDVDLPPHWRTLTWQFATLVTGATLNLSPHAAAGRVLVTHQPTSDLAVGASSATDIVAVNLAPLARTFGSPLPPGAIDAAGAVMTYSDALGYVPDTDATARAIVSGDTAVDYLDLANWIHPETQPSARTLALVSQNTSAVDALHCALSVWAAGGSLVMTDPATTAELATDAQRTQRIVDTERITHTIDLSA